MSTQHAPTTIVISTGTILKTLAALIAVGVLWEIRDILLALFTAVILAGVMYPFVRFLKGYHIPKPISVAIFYLLLFGIVTLLFWLIIPAIAQEVVQLRNFSGAQLKDFSGAQNGLLQHALEQLASWSSSLNANVATSSNFPSILSSGQRALSFAASAFTDFFGSIASFVLVFVLAFYLIAEETSIREAFRSWMPSAYRDVASNIVWRVLEKLGDWLRGQVLLGLVIGLMYYLGLSLLGVPYALVLGLMAGLLEFIPYLGPLLAAIPALVLAIGISPMTALFTLIFLVIVQQLENHLLVPKVMQRAVGLNPVVSIIAFLVGARLFGIPGAIFAIPLAMAASVVLNETINAKRST